MLLVIKLGTYVAEAFDGPDVSRAVPLTLSCRSVFNLRFMFQPSDVPDSGDYGGLGDLRSFGRHGKGTWDIMVAIYSSLDISKCLSATRISQIIIRCVDWTGTSVNSEHPHPRNPFVAVLRQCRPFGPGLAH